MGWVSMDIGRVNINFFVKLDALPVDDLKAQPIDRVSRRVLVRLSGLISQGVRGFDSSCLRC
jgi:hypothetical protein